MMKMWNLVLMVLIVGWSGAAEGGDLKKCCPWDKVPGMNSTCNPKPEAARWESPRVFSTRGLLAPGARSMAEGGPVGRPQCSKPLFALDPDIDGPYYLLQDGRLDDEEYTRPFERFCYDWDPKLRVVPYICHEETESGNEVVTAYPIGLIVSLPFLAATFMVYVLLKELRNVYGLTLICNVVSLFIGYLGLTIVLLAPDDMSADACTVLAYTIQFFFLAVFFWLNVMCFDIYWAFSGIRNLKGSAKERELKKFLLYALYAWGCPLILLVFTLIMDYSSILPASSPYKPDMGLKNCFFETSEATWLYFYGPMTVLIFANLVMFAITARRIFVHRRETSVLKSGDSKRHNNDKERFNLYLKLFVVMGINWVMELVSWVVKGPQQIWYLTDITNTLQGVFIFVIFVCKRRIFRLINQKLCPGKKLWPGHSTKSSHGASTTSHATGSTVASSGSGKKQGVSTINMEPMSEDSVRLNAEDSDGQM